MELEKSMEPETADALKSPEQSNTITSESASLQNNKEKVSPIRMTVQNLDFSKLQKPQQSKAPEPLVLRIPKSDEFRGDSLYRDVLLSSSGTFTSRNTPTKGQSSPSQLTRSALSPRRKYSNRSIDSSGYLEAVSPGPVPSFIEKRRK